MNIRIFTNEVAGGWLATDLEDFLGGSEEVVVLLARALKRSGFNVTVFHTFPEGFSGNDYTDEGVEYKKRSSAGVNSGDILITFKDNLPWRGKEFRPAVKIHWSSDVEMPWPQGTVENLDAFICLSEFHKSRSIFVPYDKLKVFPQGLDTVSLTANFVPKEHDTILYCSSPDRGLSQLLNDWPAIQKQYDNRFKLKVSYGFKNIDLMARNAKEVKSHLLYKMQQPGITYLGQLSKNKMEEEYHRSHYWTLPLNRADSELFCLNATKSFFCGCIPIVTRIGALKNTVKSHIPYKNFVSGDMQPVHEEEDKTLQLTWDQVVERYWIPLFEKHMK